MIRPKPLLGAAALILLLGGCAFWLGPPHTRRAAPG